MGLACKKRFEDITVQELCDICNYPRATFYNYFDDIYDLLEYCWISISGELEFEKYQSIVPDERLYVIFERTYDLLALKKDLISAITRSNPLDGKLMISFQNFLRKQINIIMSSCPNTSAYPIPYEIIAEHYSNAILLIMKWTFLKDKCKSKKEAIECLRFILGDLQNKLDNMK